MAGRVRTAALGLGAAIVCIVVGSCGHSESRNNGSTGETSPPSTLSADAPESFNAVESREVIWGLLADGELEQAAQLIADDGVTGALSQTTYLSISICEPATVRFLLNEVGVNPNARSDDGETPLHELTRRGVGRSECDSERMESIQAIIEAGGDPCLAPSAEPNMSPAARAAEWGEPAEVVDILAQAGDECP